MKLLNSLSRSLLLVLIVIPNLVISSSVYAVDFNYESETALNKGLIVKPNNYETEGIYDHIDNFFMQNGISAIEELEITNLVLTSDIEGNLNAVNRKTGELLWSLIGGQPLVSIKSDSDQISKHKTTPIASPASTDSNHNSINNDNSDNNNINNNNHPYTNNRRHHTSYNYNMNNKSSSNNKRPDITWIVEPYGDGSIYHFMGHEGLEKLPISIKQFVLNSPFSIDDQFVYTGSRVSGIVKVNARTGAIVESFGLENLGTCSTDNLDPYSKTDDYISKDSNLNIEDSNFEFDDQSDYYGSHDYNSEENEVGPFITLGKTIYDLTIHSKNNTSWNITYVQWGPNNLHSALTNQNSHSSDDIFIQPFYDSSLLALDVDTKSIKWVSNLPYVTVNVFDIFHNSLSDKEYIVLPHPLDNGLSSIPSDKQESTYLDRTKEGSWYALGESHYPSLVRSAPIAKYITNERWRLPSILSNDDLLGISISGVHDNSLRKNFKESNIHNNNNFNNKHLAVYQSATAMSLPEKYNQIIHGKSDYYPNGNTKNRNQNDLSNNHIESPTLTFKTSSLSQLIYRAVENVFVAIICLAIFYILSKMGLLKAFNGNKSANDHIDSIPTVTIEPSVSEPVLSSEDKTSSIQPLENNTKDYIDFDNSNELTKSIEIDNLELQDNRDDSEDTTRRKRKRGSRGGKKNKKKEMLENIPTSNIAGTTTIITSISEEDEKMTPVSSSSEAKVTEISNNLSITDDILGFGSHGTIVFKGYFENRPVAVKRMLLDFYDVASHEIHLLQESDDHSNVVRYFCSQEKNKFLYIALELCSASLEDLVEKKRKDLEVNVETREILYQIANGVRHLHSLKIVHRDIKPQNILVALSKKNKLIKENDGSVRFLISDFGLCKKLDADQSSFKGTTANAAGTSGWRAPELLLDTSPAYAEQSSANKVRLTRSVDIFSAGCVFFYVLTGGYHPFGDRYIREGNIIKGEYDLSKLNNLPDSYTVKDLVNLMIQKNPMLRPDIRVIMKHPYFWSVDKKLEFLLKVSDRFEIERRDPPSPLLLKLESIALEVLGPQGWFEKFDDKFIDNLGKYRKYNTHKLMDLLRAIRNKYHHYQDLPKDLALEMGPLPDGFYFYFQRKFPRLLLVVYKLMEQILHDDDLLGQFF